MVLICLLGHMMTWLTLLLHFKKPELTTAALGSIAINEKKDFKNRKSEKEER